MNEVTIGIFMTDRFTQLLQRPRCGRMRRDVDVQQLPRCMMDEHEDVQRSKRRCDRDEEVTRNSPSRDYSEKSTSADRHAADSAAASACTSLLFVAKRGCPTSPTAHWQCAPHPTADCRWPCAERAAATQAKSAGDRPAICNARTAATPLDANGPRSPAERYQARTPIAQP